MGTFTEVRSELTYLGALLRLNVASGLARPGLALASAAMMCANNLLFFVVWVIYFENFSSLRGWGLKDLALLMGVGAWGFGLTVALTGGVRDLARAIINGSLDIHLGRPRHPLPSLLLSRSLPSGWGDALSSLILWLWLADVTWSELPFVIAVATAGGAVLLATVVGIQSLAFWLPKSGTLADEIFNLLITVTVYPQHTYGFVIRALLFTVVPAAFITFIPVEAIREGSLIKAAAVLVAALFYAGVATCIFERGLRRYSSGNRMLELR